MVGKPIGNVVKEATIEAPKATGKGISTRKKVGPPLSLGGSGRTASGALTQGTSRMGGAKRSHGGEEVSTRDVVCRVIATSEGRALGCVRDRLLRVFGRDLGQSGV